MSDADRRGSANGSSREITRTILGNDSSRDSDVLAAADLGRPGLGEKHAFDLGYDRQWFQVDSIEVVKQTDRLPAFYINAAVEQRLVMAGKLGGDVARAIDDFNFSLCAGAVVGDRFDAAVQLAVVDRRGQ